MTVPPRNTDRRHFHRRGRRGARSGGVPSTEVSSLFATDEICPRCQKPLPLCICDTLVPLDNRVGVLILQHPQEQDKLLGTARVTARSLGNAVFKVGLSWASLAKALGRPADPAKWAILYLGAAEEAEEAPKREITLLGRKGEAIRDQNAALAGLEGIVLLDGTWSQAKTLWWRNPWVLKARRLVLNPPKPSLYGHLRREPRREGLSTLESAAFALSRLEKRPEIETTLTETFSRMLARYRDAVAAKRAVEGKTGTPADEPPP